MAIYDQIYGYIDGKLVVENGSLEINWVGNDQDVETTVQGWSGISPAPVHLEVAFTNFAPPTGSAFNAPKSFIDKTSHELKLQKGATGETLTSKGCYVRQPRTSSGVGQVTNETFMFVGPADYFS